MDVDFKRQIDYLYYMKMRKKTSIIAIFLVWKRIK
jgi:hypothetical protein